MIVYSDLNTVASDLQIPLADLYAVSNALDAHYKNAVIPKKDGGKRVLKVPSTYLKNIQRKIAEVLLSQIPISKYATAYRYGARLKYNALPHVGKNKILKLDIDGFFDSVLYCRVKEYAFPEYKYCEKARVLLSILCYYGESLPQGAPTSPAISNIIMTEFDNTVGKFCESRGISYTRYCDDMTFSGDFDENEVTHLVKTELKKYGFFLKHSKTKVVLKGRRQSVTGIVVNEGLSVQREYKRQIRKEMYYIKKLGISTHIANCGFEKDEKGYIASLVGRVNYVLTVEPTNAEMREYFEYLKSISKK